MYSSMPVPSRGALRALRQIALGTSCTIAIGTALIAEDRRRRIHTALEVRENARRLKGARQYYGAGGGVLASFEEQISHDLDIDASRWADTQYPQEPKAIEVSGPPELHLAVDDRGSLSTADEVDALPGRQHQLAARRVLASHQRRHTPSTRDNLHKTQPSMVSRDTPSEESHDGPSHLNKQEQRRFPSIRLVHPRESIHILSTQVDYKQLEIALEQKTSFLNVADHHHTQALKLAELIPRPTRTGGYIEPYTLDSCIQLSRACLEYDTLDAFLPTMQAVSEIGGIDAGSFHDLRPELYISRLLDRRPPTTESAARNTLESVKQAITIFLTPLNEKPHAIPPGLLDAGMRVFEASLEAGLYKRSISIYSRLSEYQNFEPSADHVTRLLLAIRDQGHQKHILNIFIKIFPKTQPNYSEFTAVVHEVLKSACESGWLAKAEDVLRIATEMAEALGFLTRPDWFTKVLNCFWKLSHNLETTRALFLRLQPLAVSEPLRKALYSSMVRFCILDRKATEVEQYLNVLTDKGRQNLDLRTSGYLILAKAMEKDWEGVVNSFRDLKKHTRGRPSDYADVFTPIFKLYASSHHLPETENFIRSFIEEFEIRPNKYLFNIMVDAYAKREEIGSVAAWIAAMRPYGLEIDSVTFNSMISKSFDRWPKRIHTMTRLCEKVQDMDDSLVDTATVNILRAAILLSADGNALMAERWLERVDRLKARALPVPHGNVLELMNTAIKRGDRPKAVSHYRRALEDGVMMPPDVVALAVTACLPYHRHDQNIESAMDLIAESHARGVNTRSAMEPLLLAQARNVGNDAGDMEAFFQNTLTAMEKRGLKVPMTVVTTVVASFIDRAKYRRALHFWFSMQKHNGVQDDAIDLVSLTVLLNCFLALSDVSGINWAINVLCQNGITPDARLKLLLKNSRRGVRKYLRRYPDHEKANVLLDVVESSLKVVMALRARLETRHLEERKILRVLEAASSAKAGNLGKPQRQLPFSGHTPTPSIQVMPRYIAPIPLDSRDDVPEIACAVGRI